MPTSRPVRIGRLLPDMKVQPPGRRSRAMAQDLSRHESTAVSTIAGGEAPIVWTRARGANVTDADGNIYLDMTAAFGVASLGHSNSRVAAAVRRQVGVLAHGFGDIHPHDVQVALVKRLTLLAFGEAGKAILCTTGAEAVEVALKTATLYTGHTGFLAFQGGFHGQSYGTLAVTARERFRKPFRRQVFDGVARAPYAYCYRCPLGLTYPACDIACLRPVQDLLVNPPREVGAIGAVIVEAVQGREGNVVPPPEFLPRLQDICRRHGALLVLDEIITGFSRTGAWFAARHRGVQPDLMCVGKALGNGLPISACVGRGEVMDAWKVEGGEAPHSSTFMANPVAGAAALTVISEHERLGLASRAQTLGTYALDRLRQIATRHPLIGDVRGLGLMIGVELVTDRKSRSPATVETGRVIREALRRGVIFLAGAPEGNVISMTPPLVITRRQLGYALEVLEASVALVERTSVHA